jgi:hypothetical protein
MAQAKLPRIPDLNSLRMEIVSAASLAIGLPRGFDPGLPPPCANLVQAKDRPTGYLPLAVTVSKPHDFILNYYYQLHHTRFPWYHTLLTTTAVLYSECRPLRKTEKLGAAMNDYCVLPVPVFFCPILQSVCFSPAPGSHHAKPYGPTPLPPFFTNLLRHTAALFHWSFDSACALFLSH